MYAKVLGSRGAVRGCSAGVRCVFAFIKQKTLWQTASPTAETKLQAVLHHVGAAGGLALSVLSTMHTEPKKSCKMQQGKGASRVSAQKIKGTAG